YLLLYRPDASKSQVLKDETEKLMIQVQSLQVTDVQISALQTQIEKLKVELAKTNARVSAKEELPKLIDDIKSKGVVLGVKFRTIIPEYNSLVSHPYDESAPEISKVTIHFQMQGYYKDFGRFVESLETLPFFLSVGDFSLVYEESVFPEILITVDIVLYLIQNPSQAKPETVWQS
ncbi:MAG TPA: type 4a pilus biogenesis protein PilO, partial [bacterium]